MRFVPRGFVHCAPCLESIHSTEEREAVKEALLVFAALAERGGCASRDGGNHSRGGKREITRAMAEHLVLTFGNAHWQIGTVLRCCVRWSENTDDNARWVAV